MKKLACTAAIAALGALAAAQIGSADPQRTLTFTQSHERHSFIALGHKSRGPSDPARGDLTAFAARLEDQSRNPRGRSQGYCVVADTAHRGEQCSYAFVLADGQITGEGSVVYNRRFTIPISGGTGAYAGARGSITFRIGRRTSTITLTLLP